MHHHKRTVLFGAISAFSIVFTMTFPYFSVGVAIWLFKHNLFEAFIALFALPFLATVLYFTYKRWNLIQPKRRGILILAFLLYCAAYFPLDYHPERLHVLNFSFMALILYKTFSPLMRIRQAAFFALVTTITVGTVDEFLQRWIPGRSSSFHDVMLAVKAAFLGVALAWVFDKYSRKGRS